jgi:gamma-glutamyltranspeptidase / glutathione hydrolase
MSGRIKVLIITILVSVLLIYSGCRIAENELQVSESYLETEIQQSPAGKSTPEGDTGWDRKDHVEAVVSAHNLATEAGIEILSSGGTAADAAIAVAAVLSVVEPYFSSVLGGGTWALYYDSKTGDVTSLDGVGPVGSKASIEDFAARAEFAGIHYSVIPGAWDGWMLWLEEYGVLDLDTILEPAVMIARQGHQVSSSMARWLERQSQLIPNRPDTARIYMPSGRLLRQGEIVYNHDMADTFEALIGAYESKIGEGRSQAVQAARDYFYRGPIAEAIVSFSDENGGYLTLEDFNSFEAQVLDSISIQYNDELEIHQNPPNSQGITMLLALNILKHFDFSGLTYDEPDSIHLQVEAVKLAYADRYYHIGDPQKVDIPLGELLSEGYAERQAERIDMEEAMRWPISDGLSDGPGQNDTTTFHIVDRYGNAAAVTTSLGSQFLVIGDTGIHINNRMRMVSLEESDPNQLVPGYKVRHTSCPYIVLKDRRPYILGGNIGADLQPQVQLQQFISIAEFGFSAQEAVEMPRWATTAFPAGTYPYGVANTLRMQPGFPTGARNALSAKGHEISVGGAFGSANIIIIEENGIDAQVGADPVVDTSYGIIKTNQ